VQWLKVKALNWNPSTAKKKKGRRGRISRLVERGAGKSFSQKIAIKTGNKFQKNHFRMLGVDQEHMKTENHLFEKICWTQVSIAFLRLLPSHLPYPPSSLALPGWGRLWKQDGRLDLKHSSENPHALGHCGKL
jgi:hypothetical protein